MLEVIKYKDYVFPHNPYKIQIINSRDIKELNVPFNGNVITDYGRKKRVVKGYGKFFGEDCIDQFNALLDIFKEGSIGYLSLPNINPFLAAFYSLEMIGQSGPNVIDYYFEFWEQVSSEEDEISLPKKQSYHIVKLGEDLWSIAIDYSKTIDELISLNPYIKRPDNLTVGEKVVLS